MLGFFCHNYRVSCQYNSRQTLGLVFLSSHIPLEPFPSNFLHHRHCNHSMVHHFYFPSILFVRSIELLLGQDDTWRALHRRTCHRVLWHITRRHRNQYRYLDLADTLSMESTNALAEETGIDRHLPSRKLVRLHHHYI